MNDVTRTSNEWATYERFGSIEARPYADGDQADLRISFSLADLNRTSLDGGMIARNPANPKDQWYIAPDYFAKHYRTAHEPESALDAVRDRTADNVKLRELLAVAYSGGHLYGDDGELQDNRLPPIDYYRDSVAEIERKMNERGMDRLTTEANLLREMDEYLSRSPAEAIHAGSVFHQMIKRALIWLPRPTSTKGGE